MNNLTEHLSGRIDEQPNLTEHFEWTLLMNNLTEHFEWKLLKVY